MAPATSTITALAVAALLSTCTGFSPSPRAGGWTRGVAASSSVRRQGVVRMAVDRGSRAPPQRSNEPVLPMNEKIKADPLRVIISKGGDEGDELLGVISLAEAKEKAKELSKDLVMISPKSDPPVCKIVDYGKLKYQMDRKKKENLKKTKVNELKEVKMSYKIDTHDYQVRQRSAEKFLKLGSRVKAVVQFRGREQQYMNLGTDLLNKLAVDVADIGNGEKPKREGNRMIMFINPIQEKLVKSGAKDKASKKERQAAKAAKALAKQEGGEEATEAAADAGAGAEKPDAAEEA